MKRPPLHGIEALLRHYRCADQVFSAMDTDRMPWQEWNGLEEEHRDVIRNDGWLYFRMPRWSQARHRDYPAEMQAQVMVFVVAADQLLAPGDSLDSVLRSIAQAVDACRRHLQFVL